MTEFVHVGFGNYVAINRVVSMYAATTHTKTTGRDSMSAPAKHVIAGAREQGLVINMCNGRRTKSALVTDTGHVILSALNPETLVGRLNQETKSDDFALSGKYNDLILKDIERLKDMDKPNNIEDIFRKMEQHPLIIRKADGSLTKAWENFKDKYS